MDSGTHTSINIMLVGGRRGVVCVMGIKHDQLLRVSCFDTGEILYRTEQHTITGIRLCYSQKPSLRSNSKLPFL